MEIRRGRWASTFWSWQARENSTDWLAPKPGGEGKASSLSPEQQIHIRLVAIRHARHWSSNHSPLPSHQPSHQANSTEEMQLCSPVSCHHWGRDRQALSYRFHWKGHILRVAGEFCSSGKESACGEFASTTSTLIRNALKIILHYQELINSYI